MQTVGTINYVIEKGFILDHEERKGLNENYPWDKMKVDDSFLLGSFDNKVRNTCMNSCLYFKGKYKTKKDFKSRMTDEGFRIWRTK